MIIRRMTADDLRQIGRIDANYVADSVLAITRHQEGLNVTFSITEQARQFAYVKRTGYTFSASYQHELAERMARGEGLYLVAEEDGLIVGLLDLEPESWRPVASIQWIVIDRPWRGRGIGRELMAQAIAWTRAQGLHAVVLETQNTNIDACRFYQRLGFRLSGVQDLFYFDDRVAEESALFWVYTLDSATLAS